MMPKKQGLKKFFFQQKGLIFAIPVDFFCTGFPRAAKTGLLTEEILTR
jgi:hypothetical protein